VLRGFATKLVPRRTRFAPSIPLARLPTRDIPGAAPAGCLPILFHLQDIGPFEVEGAVFPALRAPLASCVTQRRSPAIWALTSNVTWAARIGQCRSDCPPHPVGAVSRGRLAAPATGIEPAPARGVPSWSECRPPHVAWGAAGAGRISEVRGLAPNEVGSESYTRRSL
jgi:hypothetical protein